MWFELATVMSQAFKLEVITYTLYEGLNHTILDKISPLWKHIGEPPEIQIGCYTGDPGEQRHLGWEYDLFWLKNPLIPPRKNLFEAHAHKHVKLHHFCKKMCCITSSGKNLQQHQCGKH